MRHTHTRTHTHNLSPAVTKFLLLTTTSSPAPSSSASFAQRFRRRSLRGLEIRKSIEKLAAGGYVKPESPASHSPKELKSQKVEMALFNDVIRDPVAIRYLRGFLKKEYSVENLHFWQEIERYRVKAVEILAWARRIHDFYICEGAESQVNINR